MHAMVLLPETVVVLNGYYDIRPIGQPSSDTVTNFIQAPTLVKLITQIFSARTKSSHIYMCTIQYNITYMLSGVRGHSNKYATGHFPEAQCAFKILMIHEVLQFALRIAFRCVLHRCGNLDIRC